MYVNNMFYIQIRVKNKLKMLKIGGQKYKNTDFEDNTDPGVLQLRIRVA